MSKRIVARVLALMVVMIGTFGVAGPAFADDHFDMTVRNMGSWKCLAPAGESWGAGVRIVQVTCTGSAFQRWDLVDHDDHIFQLRNAVTLQCMDVLGSNSNATAVVQWPCANISNQRFQASRDLPGVVELRSRVAGTSTHCLDVPGGSSADGLGMQVWTCNGTVAQQFAVFPA